MQLWEQHPEEMRIALARHDALLTACIERHAGTVIKSRGEGDSFFAVFNRAADAAAAACDIQRALFAERWPTSTPLRVRIALHLGGTELRNGDYYGPTVNRCARLRAIAHSGQILLSQAVADRAREALPHGVSIQDLGWHRLKDLQQPEHIFQLVCPDLPSDFPTLKSLEAIPNNLPSQLTSFIGREQEMDTVKQLLKATRLLSLIGTGGCGKTRLILQVAADLLEEYPDGVWLIELATLSDPSLVPQAVAATLGVREELDRSLRTGPESGHPLLARLIAYLQPKKLLLILDNCEHLVEPCAQLAEALLRACPDLRIVATSRGALGITGETVWRVPSLSLPDPRRLPPTENLMQYEAVRLFVERAIAASPTFSLTDQNAPAVVQICYRLDGIPLAIELAAARVKVLSVEQIAARLDDRFRLLTGGSRTALPRQQTLRAMMDWSFNLLSEAERIVLRRLSVFAGGWTIEAAEAVCAGEGVKWHEVLDWLTHLVDESLVIMEERGGEARYRLLETVRQYAQEKLLDAGEAEIVRRRHRDWFLSLAEQAASELMGPRQAAWLDRLEEEHDNLWTALEWSLGSDKVEAGLHLAAALWRFWEVRGYLSEGRTWLEAALAKSGSASEELRAKLLQGAGILAWYQDDYPRAAALCQESLALYRQFNNKQGIAMALNILGLVRRNQGEYVEARSVLEESLAIFRELGDRPHVADSLLTLGIVACRQGDYPRATRLLEESLTLFRESEDERGIASALNNLGIVARYEGNYHRAVALHEESLALLEELGDKGGIGFSLYILGLAAHCQGYHERALTLLKRSLTMQRELGDRGGIARCLEGLAEVVCSQGKHERAGRLFGAAEALREVIGAPLPPSDRSDYDRHLNVARDALGEEAFTTAWTQGRAMTLEQAIAYALDEGSGAWAKAQPS